MIQHISISNFHGIDQVDADLGSIVLVEGRNGSGKTSVLAALLKIFEGGHDPGVLRRHCGACNESAPEGDQCECGGPIVTADKAKVEMMLDNGFRFLYTCTAKTYKLEGWNETGSIVAGGPKTALEEMLTLEQVSPGELLKIDATTKPGMRQLRDRLQHLIPLSFHASDLPDARTDGERESYSIAARAIESVARKTKTRNLDLGGFDQACADVRDSRTRINREREEKAKTVAALQGKVDSTSEDFGLQLDAAREVLATERTRWKTEQEQLAGEERAAKDAEERKRYERVVEIRARAEAEIAKVTAESNDAMAKITEAARRISAESQPAHEQRVAEYAADVARLEQLQQGYIESENTRRLRDEFAGAARSLGHESLRYDRALEMLDSVRIDKLKSLPIEGLEIGADFVRVDGVDWEKLNTARRMWLCIRICAHLSKGEQKILFLDHGEAFDSETFAEVKAACEAKGFQLILARVTDSPKVRVS